MIEEELKEYIRKKIATLEDILKEPMTVQNAETLTYGDKLAAIGGLNQLIGVMKIIDKDFEYDIMRITH